MSARIFPHFTVVRTYDKPGAPWIIALLPGIKTVSEFGVMLNTLLTRAVIDDFGDLVAVEAWR